MIRTGYLRWEIAVSEDRSASDPRAREVAFSARPSFRQALIITPAPDHDAVRFARGEANYAQTRDHRAAVARPPSETLVTVPDVGPLVWRYDEADRARMPRFWMEKLHREADAFAHEVVRAASRFPQLVLSNPALRAGYARLVAAEAFRVIEGKSHPEPTRTDEPMRIELQAADPSHVPELVAAELVRDVVEPKEFDEFRHFDRITLTVGDRIYRISRRAHALIEVWDAKTRKGLAQLCVVFQDPGMPPSDEVVMKYLLARHQPDLLWQIGVRFSPPTGTLDGPTYRRGRGYA
jgi:hypothetical protein